MLDILAAIYADLPPEERMAAVHADLLECIASDIVVAVPDGDDLLYKHIEHCSDEDLKNQLTLEQVRQYQLRYNASLN